MKHFLATLLLAALCAVTGYGQTLKALMYNTNNGQIVSAASNLTFTNDIVFGSTNATAISQLLISDNGFITFDGEGGIAFTTDSAATTRTNLGLGATNNVTFNSLAFSEDVGTLLDLDPNEELGQSVTGIGKTTNSIFFTYAANTYLEANSTGWTVHRPFAFSSDGIRLGTLTNLGLAQTNNVAFRNITSDGNVVISNQSTNNNGLLFIYRTNNEPFLGLANLIASNNTTISNETLFRVGVAEATNRSAQFGFRTVRTNNGGEGLATFSVFGYNALMMIGPSDRSRTNTATNAGIEADIWTITPTNRVATLRDTNTGALTLHQELGFSTNNLTTNAPATNNTVALWIEVWVGTNSYRLPLYQ